MGEAMTSYVVKHLSGILELLSGILELLSENLKLFRGIFKLLRGILKLLRGISKLLKKLSFVEDFPKSTLSLNVTQLHDRSQIFQENLIRK